MPLIISRIQYLQQHCVGKYSYCSAGNRSGAAARRFSYNEERTTLSRKLQHSAKACLTVFLIKGGGENPLLPTSALAPAKLNPAGARLSLDPILPAANTRINLPDLNI